MSANGPAWGNRMVKVSEARELAAAAQRRADWFTVRAWNVRLDQLHGSVQPSPTIGQAVNSGFRYLRVSCSGCRQMGHIDLEKVRRPAETPVWHLEGALACNTCRFRGARAPRAVIDRLSAAKVGGGWVAPPEPPEVVYHRPMAKTPMLDGRPLSDEELDFLRKQIEEFDDIGAISDDLRAIVAERWPHLLVKIKPKAR